jgi:hypothetical protein
MIGLLFGDVHRPSLERFIQDRSAAAGLDTDEKKRTKKGT